MNWGSVPDWLSGVGGAVAACVVAVAYLRERSRTAEEHRDERRRNRRAQAERITYYLEQGHTAYPAEGGRAPVAARLDSERTPVDAGWFHYHDAPGYDWGYLIVINNSQNCVYSVVAHVPQGALQWPERGIGVIPPGVTRVSMPMRDYPGDGSGAWTRHDGEFASNALIPWVEFKDQAGVTWRRRRDGSLDEVIEPVPFPDYSV